MGKVRYIENISRLSWSTNLAQNWELVKLWFSDNQQASNDTQISKKKPIESVSVKTNVVYKVM